MTAVYLVRHGQASFGAADYDQLSPLGTEQCRLLGAWFGQCGFSVSQIVTGGLKRHGQSADAFLQGLPSAQHPATARIVDAGFDEYNHREMLSRYNPALTDLDAVKRLLVGSSDLHAEFSQLFARAFGRWIGGENDADYQEPWPAFSQRCNAALTRVAEVGAATSEAGSVVVFTSGGAISAIIQKMLDVPDSRVYKLNLLLRNAGLTRLNVSPEGVALQYFNNYAYLEQSGRPELVTLL